jgi:hypothetical protein
MMTDSPFGAIVWSPPEKYSRNASRYRSDAHCELRQLVGRQKPARQKIRKNGKRKIANVYPAVCRPIRAINVKVNLRSIDSEKSPGAAILGFRLLAAAAA